MIPAEEACFIELWQQQASYQHLAAALGIPLGTVSLRAYTLMRQGKIQPRPRGRGLLEAETPGADCPTPTGHGADQGSTGQCRAVQTSPP